MKHRNAKQERKDMQPIGDLIDLGEDTTRPGQPAQEDRQPSSEPAATSLVPKKKAEGEKRKNNRNNGKGERPQMDLSQKPGFGHEKAGSHLEGSRQHGAGNHPDAHPSQVEARDFYHSVFAKLELTWVHRGGVQLFPADFKHHHQLLHSTMQSSLPLDDQKAIDGLAVCHSATELLLDKTKKEDLHDVAWYQHAQNEFETRLISQKRMYEKQISNMQKQLEHWHQKCEDYESQFMGKKPNGR